MSTRSHFVRLSVALLIITLVVLSSIGTGVLAGPQAQATTSATTAATLAAGGAATRAATAAGVTGGAAAGAATPLATAPAAALGTRAVTAAAIGAVACPPSLTSTTLDLMGGAQATKAATAAGTRAAARVATKAPTLAATPSVAVAAITSGQGCLLVAALAGMAEVPGPGATDGAGIAAVSVDPTKIRFAISSQPAISPYRRRRLISTKVMTKPLGLLSYPSLRPTPPV